MIKKNLIITDLQVITAMSSIDEASNFYSMLYFYDEPSTSVSLVAA
jgi:hypothetical protein